MGDDEDFTAYMGARWPVLVRSLVLLGCNRHEAEDVAQTAMARCYASWPRVRRASDIDAYVYRTLLNCWSKSRRRRWWAETPTEHLPESHHEDDPVLRVALEHALSKLSAEHRAVLVLRFVADMTESQVADVLGVPIGTVKSRVSRALANVDLDDLREETP
jgi:RNA polymerase sigma-70 factor (sigma-E family)